MRAPAAPLAALFAAAAAQRPAAQPRSVVARGGHFVDAANRTVLLQGTNVVMKGPPWIPEVGDGTEAHCSDRWWSNYTCYTFSEADAVHITQTMGWNYIRLGVVWAGAQPTPDPVLDAGWVARLHAVLDLCHKHGIHVLLDVHQDAVGTATCGEGVPQWFSALATPNRIGKPLTPLLPPGKSDAQFPWPTADGLCMRNDTASWALHAGAVDYNTRNPCCTRYNQGGSAWGRLIGTLEAQETITYLFETAKGREYYATYMGLLAEAVRDYPAAIGIELMNEPPSIERGAMWKTWKACYDKIRPVVPDLGVGVMDVGQGVIDSTLGIAAEEIAWLKQNDYLFYAFHDYTNSAPAHVQAALKFTGQFGMPSLMTEMGDCSQKVPATAAGIGWSFWEYSNYCDTAPSPACLPGGKCDFGACVTGTNGRASYNLTCPPGTPPPSPSA